MRSILRTSAAARLGAILLLAGPLASWLAELVTAAAWQNPHYAPLHNWVSHLGVTGPETAFGQVAHSPLAWAMNTGWIAYGILLIIGAFLVFDLRTGRLPVVLALLATASGVGVALVGIFHGSQENVENGLIWFHTIGAQLVMITGNVFAIVVGASARRLGIARGLARTEIVLGVIGLVAFLAFMIDVRTGIAWNLGMFERGAIYPIMAGHALLAAALINGARQARYVEPTVNGAALENAARA